MITSLICCAIFISYYRYYTILNEKENVELTRTFLGQMLTLTFCIRLKCTVS